MRQYSKDKLIDDVASAVHEWPEGDDTRRTYLPLALPSMIRRLWQRLRDALQALADVRTLDDWALAAEFRHWTGHVWVGSGALVILTDPGETPRAKEFQGATPDEARAKAAAWVRSERERGQR